MAYQIFSNSAPNFGNITINANTGYRGAGIYQITGSNGNYNNTTWATVQPSSSSSIQVKGDAEFEGRVMINGADLAKTLETIQNRLAILVPDPKLLDKYEALKQAYEHYKTLEALCVETNKSNSEQ